jgi:CBS domain-containing protein
METSLIIESPIRSAASMFVRTEKIKDAQLEAGDSAFCALTDFRRECAIAIDMNASIDDALAAMTRLGVHALLVVQESGGSGPSQVIGLITAYDITRERPHRLQSARTSIVLKPFLVRDLMTPWSELSLVQYESLQTWTAEGVYQMFQGTGLTHLLVVERHGDDAAVAVGMLSRAALAKRLQHRRSSCS